MRRSTATTWKSRGLILPLCLLGGEFVAACGGRTPLDVPYGLEADSGASITVPVPVPTTEDGGGPSPRPQDSGPGPVFDASIGVDTGAPPPPPDSGVVDASDASVCFLAPATYAVGLSPNSLVVADFNGDDKLDLAVTNLDDNTIGVLINAGGGAFQPQVTYGTGEAPWGLAAGDLNGDGLIDLAVANQSFSTAGSVGVFLNAGNGTFAAEAAYAAGKYPSGIAMGDFDQDGKLDLVIGNVGDGTVATLLNLGNGTFGPQNPYPVGDFPYSVITGDFVGQGNADVAFTNEAEVGVLLNNGVSLGEPLGYAVGSVPQVIAAGDLNGDGKLDLAATNSNSNTVSVLLSMGDAVFYPHVDYAVGSYPVGLAIADYNGDGALDLAVANAGPSGYASTTVSLLINAGAGAFGDQATLGAGLGPSPVAAGDFNGDGKQDLAVGNSVDDTISVLLSCP